MDFRLTTEQEAMRRTVRDFAKKRITPHVADWEEREEFPRGAFQELSALGLAGMHCPQEYGGMGLDRLTGALVYEEIGQAYQG